ncbi:virulence RhuM family protein [Porphyromonas uenonis]|uniref:virulence RhuM family protein n=1 Tax=Porphyromonas uenonis TaxID=281920 RepID=UPI0026F0066C|nr:virulence RhuM family protein [Porphyromonas uenonis]
MDEQRIIIYNSDDGRSKVTLYAQDGSVWLNQSQLAELFDTSKQSISYHITNILADKELDANSVVKDYLTTASDGKQYNVAFYSLEMILAIGFRVRSRRGTQFRQWAMRNLREYMVKGFVIDDERLKNPDGRPDYFDELLERIREIRASEKRFYQKVRDLLALSSDYDTSDKKTQMFFAEIQNKLIYAVTHQTAAELILSRADASKPNMALTSWQGNVVRKQDILIAKNYLRQEEIDQLNRLTTLFLDSAELRVKERRDLTLNYWRSNVDALLQFQGKDLLLGKGAVTHKQMELQVRKVYAQFDQRRKLESLHEEELREAQELKQLEENVIARTKEDVSSPQRDNTLN